MTTGLKPFRGAIPGRTHWAMRGLRFWMPFWEGSGDSYDISGRNNHGTNNGATWVAGRSGWALDFGGDGDYVAAERAPITGSQPRTVTCWINTRDTSGGSSSGGPSGNGASHFIEWGEDAIEERYTIRFEDGNLRFEVAGAGQKSDLAIAVNTWYFMALVQYGDTFGDCRIYRGRDVFEFSGSRSINTAATNPINIGRSIEFDRPYDGRIEDVRVYDYPLSLPQLDAIRLDPWAPFRRSRAAVFFVPSGGGSVSVTLETGAGTGAGQSPSVAIGEAVSLSLGSGAGSGASSVPSIAKGHEVTAPTGSGSGVGHPPSVTVGQAVSVTLGSGAGTAAGNAPSVAKGQEITLAAGSGQGVGHTPTVNVGDSVSVTLGVGSGVGAGQSPTIAKGVSLTPVSGSGTGTGHAPSVSVGGAVSVTLGVGSGIPVATQPSLTIGHSIPLAVRSASGQGHVVTVTTADAPTGNNVILQLSSGGIFVGTIS